MKTNLLATSFLPVLICFCLMPASSFGQIRNGRESAKRTYNDSLKQLFVDLEAAKTPEQLRSARNRAREGFRRALDQDSSYCLPYYNLGVLAEADGDRLLAIEYFEKFTRLSDKPDLSLKAKQKLNYLKSSGAPDNGGATRKQADYEDALRKVTALINLGLLKEAISVAAHATQIDPSRWESYTLIGAALLDRKQFGDALGFLKQASLRAPASIRAKLSAAIKVCEASK